MMCGTSSRWANCRSSFSLFQHQISHTTQILSAEQCPVGCLVITSRILNTLAYSVLYLLLYWFKSVRPQKSDTALRSCVKVVVAVFIRLIVSVDEIRRKATFKEFEEEIRQWALVVITQLEEYHTYSHCTLFQIVLNWAVVGHSATDALRFSSSLLKKPANNQLRALFFNVFVALWVFRHCYSKTGTGNRWGVKSESSKQTITKVKTGLLPKKLYFLSYIKTKGRKPLGFFFFFQYTIQNSLNIIQY